MTTIRNIVDEMRQGTAYCEYWQRDWSWSRSNIATLWDSLFKGHPIGLFTFWERPCPKSDFLPENFDNLPEKARAGLSSSSHSGTIGIVP